MGSAPKRGAGVSSVSQYCPTLCNPMSLSTPGLPVHHQLPESTQTHVHCVMMPSNHLILCRPLLLLPSIFPSLRVFSNESALCTRWPKYWSFSFSISPSDEYSGLISFRIDWFDLFAVQVTLKSLLQLLCTTGPDLFTDFTHETWFTGNQERPLLKCFSDCALTIRKQVRKVLGNPWTYYELHYFDGRLSCLIVENNDLKV